MKRFAACLVAITAAGFAAEMIAGGPAAAAQDKPAGKPDDKAPPKKDEKKPEEKKPVAAEWGTDYEKALATAKKEKKVVLADFTGSDW
jgi:hypothetical protein